MKRTDPKSISADLYAARRNLQVFIEMLPTDPSMTIIGPLLALVMDLRLLDRRVRSEIAPGTRTEKFVKKVSLMRKATSILSDRYARDLIVDPSVELVRMRLFVAEMDSDLTNALHGGG